MEKDKKYYLTQYNNINKDVYMVWTEKEWQDSLDSPEEFEEQEVHYEVTVTKVLKINKVYNLKITEE
jgi:hypothetical protein